MLMMALNMLMLNMLLLNMLMLNTLMRSMLMLMRMLMLMMMPMPMPMLMMVPMLVPMLMLVLMLILMQDVEEYVSLVCKFGHLIYIKLNASIILIWLTSCVYRFVCTCYLSYAGM